MQKKIYIYAPYIVSLLVAVLFSSNRDAAFFASDAASEWVGFVGRWIPMVDNLHVATNYSTFIAFAYSILWLFTPLMAWCGWQTIKLSTPQAKDAFFTKNSRFKRGLFYACFSLMAFVSFALAWPTAHRGSDIPYLYTGFIGMSFDFCGQAFIFWGLGGFARCALVEERQFLNITKQGEQNG
jgi:hypothetical protein